MLIRKALLADAEQIWTVHTKSIRQLCSRSYTRDQIAEWIGFLTPERCLEPIKTLEFVVAEVDGQVQGFCILNLETGELHAIYNFASRDRTRIWPSAYDLGRSHGPAPRMDGAVLEGPLNAVPFYEKCGFRSERTTNHPLPSGTPRACVEMRKAL